MEGAVKGGHKELVYFFIEKGACDWNRGMRAAATRGDKELVDFFIAKGADNWNRDCMVQQKEDKRISSCFSSTRVLTI